MSSFKIGDLVTPINAVDYEFRNAREHLLGKVLMVTMVLPDEEGVNVRAGIVEGKEWYWFSDDLRLVSAVQPEPEADPAPAPAAPTQQPETMRANWGGPGFLNPYADTSPTEPPDPAPAAVAEGPEPLVWVDGATHYQPHQDAFYKRVSAHEWYVWSRIVEREPLHWCKAPGTSDSAEWVVRNQPTDPAPAAAQKPLRRGDLVEYQGDICVVLSKGADRDGEYYGIAPLTGTFNYYWADIDDLTRIGSIRKKVKRLKAQMEDAK